MKILLLALFFKSAQVQSNVKTENFSIQFTEQGVAVRAPEKKRPIYSILIENNSLSNQVAKLSVKDKVLKYISIRANDNSVVEIENTSDSPVVLTPLSPAFQEVELTYGKKAYEIPSKE
jgi:Trk K+ transport system NAD-binding subunit